MRAVGYVRVSTREQDEAVQIMAIGEFARERGIELVKFYVDRGESGAKFFAERPGARMLLEELEAVKPDCVIAWSIDRVGRTMLDTVQTIMSLEERGVRVLTVREEWLQTLDADIRRLVLSILSWVAEFERRRIRERQEEAWRMGKRKGRPEAMSKDKVLKYVTKYPELAKHNKRALWLVAKGDGHKISYQRFTAKVNEVLKELGWW